MGVTSLSTLSVAGPFSRSICRTVFSFNEVGVQQDDLVHGLEAHTVDNGAPPTPPTHMSTHLLSKSRGLAEGAAVWVGLEAPVLTMVHAHPHLPTIKTCVSRDQDFSQAAVWIGLEAHTVYNGATGSGRWWLGVAVGAQGCSGCSCGCCVVLQRVMWCRL